MTASIEYFDPRRHGAIVRDFVASASVHLNVSSRNVAAIVLYRKFGFHEYRREHRYRFWPTIGSANSKVKL
jgi:ribosomal protein S18 acetylase RimI-like enzyme